MTLPADANLLIRLDHTSNIWQDTGGATAATANGAPVSRWDDASGNGNNATLVSGDSTATLQVGKYSQRSVGFATSRLTFGQPTALVNIINGTTPYTVFAHMKPSLYGTQYFWLTKGNNAYRLNFQTGIAPTGQPLQWGLASLKNTPGYDNSALHTYGYTWYTGEQHPSTRYYFGGGCVANTNSVPSTASLDTTSDIVLGGLSTSTNYRLAGDVAAVYVYSRSLSPLEILTLSDYCYSSWGPSNPRLSAPYQLVFSGNSLFTIAGNWALPERVRTFLGLPVGSVNNLAIGSQTNSQMITDDPSRLDPLLSSYSNPFLIGWECHNEQVTSTYQTWLNNRISAGWTKPGLGTELPSTVSGFNATRATQNVTIRGWSSTANVWDVASDPVVGPDAAASDLGLYSDGTHYTESGSAYVGASLAKFIQSVKATSGGTTVLSSSKSGQRRRGR